MGKGQCFSSARLLLGLFGLMLVFVSCNKRWQEEGLYYRAPNWTSDGKIVFMRDHYIQKFEQDPFWGGTRQVGGHQEIFVCEIDVGGKNFREVCKIVDEDFERGPEQVPISTSSAGDYIVISKEDWRKGEHYTEMFIMKRDGTGLKNLGKGSWPDLSPDAKRLVYQKPYQGLWIAGSDGGFDSELDGDVTANSPVWSNDGRKIGYSKNNKVYIVDTLGSIVDTTRPNLFIADWSPEDSNKVLCWDWKADKSVIVDLYQLNEDTLTFQAIKWSPDGSFFIGYDEEGYFIIKRDGTNKWYLKP